MASTGCTFFDQHDTQESVETLDYHSYLQLDQILNANHTRSSCHTEHLFITIHQVYELWFKQMIHEVQAIVREFEQDTLDDKRLLFIHHCLTRISKILKNMGEEFAVLETMTAIEFLEFRRHLGTASGFQSWQFRVFENLMGLKPSNRNKYAKRDYKSFLRQEHADTVTEHEAGPNLFNLICNWLASWPQLYSKGWDFWESYQSVIRERVEQEEELEESWRLVLDEDYYEELKNANRVFLPYEAFKGAIFITCYRNEPLLQVPFQIINTLMDIEANLRGFRMRHANMVHRMIGSKVGTGGSSGYHYLRTSATKHQIFSDLFEMAGYYLPPGELPNLPKNIEVQLGTPIAENKQCEYKFPENIVPKVTCPMESLRTRLFSSNV